MLAKHEFGGLLKHLTLAMPLYWFSMQYLNDPSLTPPCTRYENGCWTGKDNEISNVYDRTLQDREELDIPRDVLSKKQEDQSRQIASEVLVKELSQCFERIKRRTIDCGLESLRLTVIVDNGRTLHAINKEVAECGKLSAMCMRLFKVAMSALAVTQLTVNHIDLFSTTPYRSISCTQLTHWMKRRPAGCKSVFKRIKSLAISASRLSDQEWYAGRNACNRVGDDCSIHGFKHDDSFWTAAQGSWCTHQGRLPRFINGFSTLHTLNLRLYLHERYWQRGHHERLSSQLLFDLHLPSLQHLALRGVSVPMSHLQRFLQANKGIQRLSLCAFDFESVYANLTISPSTLPLLEELHLEDVFCSFEMFAGEISKRFGSTSLDGMASFDVEGNPANHVVYSGIFGKNAVTIKGSQLGAANIKCTYKDWLLFENKTCILRNVSDQEAIWLQNYQKWYGPVTR